MFSLTNNCDSTKTDQLQTIRTIYHIYYIYYTNTNPQTHIQTHTLAISIVPKETDSKMNPDTCSLPKYYLCNIESLIFDNFNKPKTKQNKPKQNKWKKKTKEQKQIIKCNFYITIRNWLRAFLVDNMCVCELCMFQEIIQVYRLLSGNTIIYFWLYNIANICSKVPWPLWVNFDRIYIVIADKEITGKVS